MQLGIYYVTIVEIYQINSEIGERGKIEVQTL